MQTTIPEARYTSSYMQDPLQILEKEIERRIPTSTVLLALTLTVLMGVLLLTHSYSAFPEGISMNHAYYAEISSTSTPFWLQAVSSPGAVNVPILVYHIVRPSYPDDSAEVRALAHTPEVFDAQMTYIQDAGYHLISFRDLSDHFQYGTSLPQKPMILSFDDGWKDQFEYAFPILLKHHYTATFFVFTNSIGKRSFLSWDNLKTLRDAGMTIGSHSRSHPYLTHITNPAALADEIFGSKKILEKNLGITVNEFAYPFGQYNQAIIALVQQAGYTSARGDFYSGQQSQSILYTLSAINTPTTLAGLAQKFP